MLTCTSSVNHLQAARQPTSQDLTVTYSGTNIPLGQVFKAIQKQTGYIAMYNVAATKLDTKEKVTVNFNSTPLGQVMDYILRGKNLEWQLDDESILIFIKKESDRPKKSPSEGEDSTIVRQSLTGKVTDADGKPIIGATVQVKGTSNGATTDPDGNFSLANVKGNAALVISSIGYQTREVPVRGKTILAQLNVVVSDLDETIVVAYGTTTRRFNTGNIGSIKAKDIEKQPVNNPLLALQGRVPGLFITQTNGLSGGGVTVRIQGRNSILNGNDPFYVVDGVPYVSQMLSTTTGGGGVLGGSGGAMGSGQGNPLSYINPGDIESIEVLKDADATAIYGSRAANGAILITTKKGKIGETKVDINLQTGWGYTPRRLKLMNTQQYLQMRNEALKNDGMGSPSSTDYDINGVWDTTRYTDWQKELIGKSTRYTNISGSVSGGTEVVQYLVTGTYRKETAPFPGDFADQKGNLHFNLSTASLGQKFKFQLSGNYMIDDNQLPYVDMAATAITIAPNAPALYNADGSLNWQPDANGTSTWDNPLSFTYNEYQNRSSNLIGNAVLSYQILSNLEIKSSFGYNSLQTKEFTAYPLISMRPEYRPMSSRSAMYSDNTINSWIVEPQINYNFSIGKGRFDVLVGTTIQQRNSNGENFNGTGYNSDEVLRNIKAASVVRVNSALSSLYKYNAIFGRINYNLKEKYIINITGRRDGSSRFGDRNQFHNFTAMGLGWIFGEERAIKRNLSFLSFGKLRGSYGTTGSDQIPDYQFLNLYDPINLGSPYQGGTGLVVNRLSNPYLQWEETKKLQIGIELGFINDRVFITSNYVRNRSSNQLLFYPIPSFTGFSTIMDNFPAVVQNQQWEFAVSTTNVINKNFIWSSNINLTTPQNKLVSFPELASSSYDNTLIIGQPINVQKVFHFIGVDPATGGYQFADSHGDPTENPDWLNDKKVIVNTTPRYYGGVENSFTYKRFQLDILLQFVKQTASNILLGQNAPPGWRGSNQPVSILDDHWRNVGDNASIQQFSADYRFYGQFLNAAYSSDVVFTDASYVRMKNLSFSYELSDKLKRKMRMRACKVFFQGQNLFTITKFKGVDPESGNGVSPALRMFTTGLQVGF